MDANPSALPVIAAAIASGVFALAGVVATSFLAKRRDHENTWRQTKVEHYQEYIAALSSIVSSRATSANQERYADAFNALFLVAPRAVLQTIDAFQAEITYLNKVRSQERYETLLAAAIQAMRDDVQPLGQKSQISRVAFVAPPPK